eukprot:scaffold57395_cov31-Tisochrysis_lutea.AAC.2
MLRQLVLLTQSQILPYGNAHTTGHNYSHATRPTRIRKGYCLANTNVKVALGSAFACQRVLLNGSWSIDQRPGPGTKPGEA